MLFGIMYILGFLPVFHIILIDELVPVAPENFSAQVSKSYALICRNGPILNSCSVVLTHLILIFLIYLDCDFYLCLLSFSSSSNEFLLQHFATFLIKQKIVLEVSD